METITNITCLLTLERVTKNYAVYDAKDADIVLKDKQYITLTSLMSRYGKVPDTIVLILDVVA